jgi:hypothetical protein
LFPLSQLTNTVSIKIRTRHEEIRTDRMTEDFKDTKRERETNYLKSDNDFDNDEERNGREKVIKESLY